MAIDIQRLAPELNVWIVRLNGDGTTFDAVCTVRAISETCVIAEGAMAKYRGALSPLLDAAAPYFKARGYTRLTYRHKQKEISRPL